MFTKHKKAYNFFLIQAFFRIITQTRPNSSPISHFNPLGDLSSSALSLSLSLPLPSPTPTTHLHQPSCSHSMDTTANSRGPPLSPSSLCSTKELVQKLGNSGELPWVSSKIPTILRQTNGKKLFLSPLPSSSHLDRSLSLSWPSTRARKLRPPSPTRNKPRPLGLNQKPNLKVAQTQTC